MDRRVNTWASLNSAKYSPLFAISKFEMMREEISARPHLKVVREWESQFEKVEVNGCVVKSVDHHLQASFKVNR